MDTLKRIFTNSNGYTLLTTTISAVTAGFIIYMYLKTSDETFQQHILKKLTKLHKQININKPSQNQFKQIMKIAIQSARHQVRLLSKNFNIKRKQYKGQIHQNKMKQYLNLLYQQIIQTDAIAVRQLKQICMKCGISQLYYQRYDNIVQQSLKQIMQGNDQYTQKQLLTLQITKQAIKNKIKFIKQYGNKYVQLIINSTINWQINKKQTLSIIFPMVISDITYQNINQYDSDLVQQSLVKYQNQLLAELQQLQIVMTPLMLKLNTAIRSVTGYDLCQIKTNQQSQEMVRTGRQMDQLHQIQQMQMKNYQDINKMILLNSSHMRH